MRDVSELDLSTELFGCQWSLPVGLGPVGMSGMYARRGEVQAARAAKAACVPFSLSTLSVCPVREIAAELETPFWLQLYIVKDRAFLKEMLATDREHLLQECAVLDDIELQPEWRLKFRRDLAHRTDAERGQGERDAGGLRGPRGLDLAPAGIHPRHPDWTETNRQ